MSDIRDVLNSARLSILQATGFCAHDVSCADPACVASGHEHEGGEDDWGCGHDCSCIPACKGFEPATCQGATRIRDLVAHIDSLLAAPPPAKEETPACPGCEANDGRPENHTCAGRAGRGT